jgi:predicted DNA binding protein
MWKAKLAVYDEEGIYASRAKKFGVSVHGYMLNYYSDKNSVHVTLLAFVEGNDKIKKEFIKDLRKDKKVDEIEDEGNFFICRLSDRSSKERQRFIKLFYNPLLIQVRPFVVYPDGWEELELASFDRKHLEEIIKVSEKKLNLKLRYLKKEKLDNLGILNVLPKLTEKQRVAVEAATAGGYYEYPRKIDVKRLAKRKKLSFSTFQEHLRKAENKLIPFAVKKLG